jgi:hypothetical protein
MFQTDYSSSNVSNCYGYEYSTIWRMSDNTIQIISVGL